MESENGVWDAFVYCHVNMIKTFNGTNSSSENIIPALESGCGIQRKRV